MLTPNSGLKTLTSYIGEATADNLSTKLRLNLRFLTRHFATLATNQGKDVILWDAIKDGNEEVINDYLAKYSIEILQNELSIALELERDTIFRKSRRTDPYIRKSFDTNLRDYKLNVGNDEISNKVILTITPIHLAIIARQISIVRIFMEKLSDEIDNEGSLNVIANVLRKVAVLSFPKNPLQYAKDDRSLDGMNVFHLAAKYCTPALKVLFDTLNTKGLIHRKEFHDTLEAKESQLQQTPLHVAAKCGSPAATR